MIKHTPGPWTHYPEDNIIVSKSGYRLLDWIARSTAVSIDERNANARLIAAAPELLEALQHLFNSYKSLADSGDAGNWKIEDQPEGIKALEAIRKATGE